MDIKLDCSHELSLSYEFLGQNDGTKECQVCGEKISAGTAYTCGRCEVWLHDSCASKLPHLPREIIHPLHSQHHIELHNFYFDFVCDKCLYISTGSRYRCYPCQFNLDLACASSVTDPLPEGERKKKKIQHYSCLKRLSSFKYRKIKEDDYNCSWCEKRLSGVCYGDVEDKFFLHELCRNKIPRAISHPFHPSHPLRLHYFSNWGNYCNACGEDIKNRAPFIAGYLCQMCDFSLDFHCVKLLPTLKHKCHDHLLTYFRQFSTPFNCNSCGKRCRENFYRCVQCNFNLHFHCVPIPYSVKHRYHRHPLIFKNFFEEDDSGEYYCDFCEEERNPKNPVYCCEKCTCIAHIHCVLNEVSSSTPTTQSMNSTALVVNEMEHNEGDDGIYTRQQILFQPLIHQHPMEFFEVTEKSRKICNACYLVLSGRCYICTTCSGPYQEDRIFREDFFLHEKCAKLPYERQHPFHSSHRLYLYATKLYQGVLVCDECRDICLGFFYLCDECNFILDVKCATLTAHKDGMSQLKEMERVIELNPFCHHDKLVLGNSNDPTSGIECLICQLPIFGPAYFCPRGCSYFVHESCLRLPQKMQVPFHLEHMLVFDSSFAYRLRCDACRLKLPRRFRISCEQCSYHLHSICANSLRRPLEWESHEHNLYYFGTKCQLLFAKHSRWASALFCCERCENGCEGRPFYRCLLCEINFHLECVPMPHSVKNRYHIHPLVIKDSFVEDDSGEYYCDICEEKRCPDDHVYCCEECKGLFITHVECALAKVEEVLSYLDPQERRKSYCSDDESPVQDKKDEDATAPERKLEEVQGTSSEVKPFDHQELA